MYSALAFLLCLFGIGTVLQTDINHVVVKFVGLSLFGGSIVYGGCIYNVNFFHFLSLAGLYGKPKSASTQPAKEFFLSYVVGMIIAAGVIIYHNTKY